MTITKFCDTHQACCEGRSWAHSRCGSMQEVWDKAPPAWLVWVATRPGVLDERERWKLAVRAVSLLRHLVVTPAFGKVLRRMDREEGPRAFRNCHDELMTEFFSHQPQRKAGSMHVENAILKMCSLRYFDTVENIVLETVRAVIAEATNGRPVDLWTTTEHLASRKAQASFSANLAAWLRRNVTPYFG